MQVANFSLQVLSSQWARIYFLSIHVLLIISMLILLIDYQNILIVLIFIVYLHYRYICYCNFSSTGKKTLICIEFVDGVWALGDVSPQPKIWLKDVTVWRWLIVLNFYSKEQQRHYPVILWPDSSDKDSLRRLRLLLRHMPVFTESSENL